MRLLAATLACLLALAAGAIAVAAAPHPRHLPPPEAFLLVFERSGGLAPSYRALVVEPGQHAIAVSARSGEPKHRTEFRIGKRRIRALESSLRRARFHSLEQPGPSGCADCFKYDFLYLQHEIELDESQVPPLLGDAIAEIEAVISARTKTTDG